MSDDITQIIAEVVREEAATRVKRALIEQGDTLTQYAKRHGRFAKDDLIETKARQIMQQLMALVRP